MICLMGRALWFGAVSSHRAFDGSVSVRDVGVTPSLPPFAPNSILALENELFVASPLMPSFAGLGHGPAWAVPSVLDVVLFLCGLTHCWLLRLIVPS